MVAFIHIVVMMTAFEVFFIILAQAFSCFIGVSDRAWLNKLS